MIETIVELLLFVGILIVFAAIVSYALLLRAKVNKLSNQLAQEIVDKLTISAKLSKLVIDQNAQGLQQSDGFVKFLSDSRDSAFKYIEDVQKELQEFMKEVGPVVEAYRVMPVKNTASQKLVTAYDKLIKIMPDEVKDN